MLTTRGCLKDFGSQGSKRTVETLNQFPVQKLEIRSPMIVRCNSLKVADWNLASESISGDFADRYLNESTEKFSFSMF